jgi:transcriptional regulator with XRE-family HTH domain
MEKETIQQTIGNFIYTERKKQKLSLAKLSEKAFGNNHNATLINNIEKGVIKHYSVETLNNILKGLGFSLKELFKN